MGHYLTADDVRERFVRPLAELSGDFAKLCKRWENAYETGRIARPDLLLNDVLPEAAILRLAQASPRRLLQTGRRRRRRLSLPQGGSLAGAAAEIAARKIALRAAFDAPRRRASRPWRSAEGIAIAAPGRTAASHTAAHVAPTASSDAAL